MRKSMLLAVLAAHAVAPAIASLRFERGIVCLGGPSYALGLRQGAWDPSSALRLHARGAAHTASHEFTHA